MEELIPLQKNTINDAVQQTVNARELHEFLQVKGRFNDWITRRIAQYGFLQDIDFIVTKNGVTTESMTYEGAKIPVDYHVTLDMAKELAMVERTKRGKEARQYFIACEKLALEQKTRIPPLTNPSNTALIEMIIRVDAAEAKADLALKGQQWLTVRQYVAIHQLERQLPMGRVQQDYGKWLVGYCRDRGFPVYKAKSTEGWDENTYPVWAIADTLAGWLGRQNSQGYL